MDDRPDMTIRGGLVTVYRLDDAKILPQAMELVKADFKVEDVRQEQQRSAELILAALAETPDSFDTYIAQQRLYNMVSYANEKRSAYETAYDCRIELATNEPITYRAILPDEIYERGEAACTLFATLQSENELSFLIRLLSVNYAERNIVFVPVHQSANIDSKKTYKIRFTPSSFVFKSRERTMRKLYEEKLTKFVYPQAPSSPTAEQYVLAERRGLPHLSAQVNEAAMQLNKLQMEVLFAILSGHHGQTPFILHGPPGTGKTTTLVEAVRLLLKLDGDNAVRVLVCTPSNTAADLFALMLLSTNSVTENELVRMYSLTRPVRDQNEQLRQTTCITRDDIGQEVFGISPKKDLLKKKVIICTLCASSYLVSGDFVGKFSHIIIDEAGQANEMETYIPIVGLATKSTRVVLAGDHKQLGPVEKAAYLDRKHLVGSLLERFSEMEIYQNDKRLICMLEDCYRSHPAIIQVPSERFYHGKLVAASPIESKSTLCQWSGLPKQHFPILWHNITSIEQQEQGGHSFSNRGELEVVVNYVKDLLAQTNVQENEIGIISPYNFQVRLLRQAFASSHPNITIDCVERFQGSERRVIIVSTVRHDKLGFLCSDKRFCTTITRAEELLVVVGNCNALANDASWASFLDHCFDNEAIIGEPLSLDAPNMNTESTGEGLHEENGAEAMGISDEYTIAPNEMPDEWADGKWSNESLVVVQSS
jgi:DNA polymerase III delta prime subunit